MDKYIWGLYNGNLVFQKRKNGLLYDAKTMKPLSPQPKIPNKTV